MLKQIQKTLFKILEKELLIVLAVLVLAVFGFWVNAADDSITFNLSVIPAGGTITVTYPDGEEDWKVNTTETITWTTQGSIDNVKIELQRENEGDWEELTASTANDGSFPWLVTSPTTTQALIKISKVGDLSINDTSDAVFTISSAGGGGGGAIPNPAIDTIVPREFSNAVDVNIIITGVYFEWGTRVWLGDHYIQPTNIQPGEISLIVPAGFPMGEHTLCIHNLSGGRNCYHLPIIIYDKQYEAAIIDQFNPNLVLLPNERIEVWVTLRNNSNYVWTNTSRLGVINDQSSIFYDPTTWITINRATYFRENQVSYGETGTLEFYIKAPGEMGEYDEFFVPVIENVKWLTAPEIKWHVKVVSVVEEVVLPPITEEAGGKEEIYSATWLRQSPYPTLDSGTETTLWVDFRNTGNMPWLNYGDYPARLGTSRLLDRISDFKSGDWISNSRLTQVQNNNTSWTAADGTVQPGEIGRFTFTIKANNGPGIYREYLRPVVEYITWMEDWGVYWDITIKGEVKPPVTGGTIEFKKPEFTKDELKFSGDKVLIKVEKQYPAWVHWLLSWLGFISI